MYTVKHAAALTGISPATLRAWERRYDVVRPARSASGYREYDEAALQRLVAMQALVASGCSPREAADRVRSGTTRGRVDGPGPVDADDQADEGAGHPAPVATLGDVDALATQAADLDAAALASALDEAFAAGPFEEVVDGWLLPALDRLGSAWRSGAVSVGGEHFVSAAVNRRLAGVFEAAEVPAGAARVLVGLPRGARHELGVLTFAAVLRRSGLDVVYLGADLPPESWVVAVTAQRPAAVVLGVPTADDVAPVRETVAALAAAAPDLPVHLGGAHQDLVGGPAEPLGHDLTTAARGLAGRLAPA